MRAFAAATQFPQFGSVQTYAAFPVWAGSTRSEVKFSPLPKRQAVKIYHDARRFERQTRRGAPIASGICRTRQGALGQSGLAVLHALLFDFLNYSSGRLDPSWAAIAEKACVSIRTVGRVLPRLKAAGVIHWLRRCSESYDERRYVLAQETNAYGVTPPSQWRGYRAPPEPPPPDPASLGAPPALYAGMSAGANETRHGQHAAAIAAWEACGDPLSGALARFAKKRQGA